MECLTGQLSDVAQIEEMKFARKEIACGNAVNTSTLTLPTSLFLNALRGASFSST